MFPQKHYSLQITTYIYIYIYILQRVYIEYFFSLQNTKHLELLTLQEYFWIWWNTITCYTSSVIFSSTSLESARFFIVALQFSRKKVCLVYTIVHQQKMRVRKTYFMFFNMLQNLRNSPCDNKYIYTYSTTTWRGFQFIPSTMRIALFREFFTFFVIITPIIRFDITQYYLLK